MISKVSYLLMPTACMAVQTCNEPPGDVGAQQANTSSFQNETSFVQSDQISAGHVRPAPNPNVVLLGGDPFNGKTYSDGLAAGGVDAFDMSDKPFYPEIYYDGSYHPICGIDFNDEAAAKACQDIEYFTEANPDPSWMRKERLMYGGRVVKTNVILEQDAMPVGACSKGETLDSCTAGGNAFGDLNALDGRCTKGNPVGVQIVCYRKCRKFGQRQYLEEYQEDALQTYGTIDIENFEALDVCAPFLKNTTTYYLEDETYWIEDQSIFDPSITEQFASLLNVMNHKCATNVIELVCHSVFKECKEVEVDDPFMGISSVMLPSLPCKSECERHKTIWDNCVAQIQNDPDDKKLFESNMMQIVTSMYALHWLITGEDLPKGENGAYSRLDLLDCDAKAGEMPGDVPNQEIAASSWIFGRLPQTSFRRGGSDDPGIFGWAFPRFMLPGMLYPEISSTYQGPDGVSYEVPCTIPQEADAIEITCPDQMAKAILPQTNRGCVYACPVSQFSLEEYNTMWAVFVTIGMCGFILNLFMVCTWKLSGRRAFDSLPFQLKASVFFGLLYGFVETIPSMILKHDLPCIYETVEEVGNSALCFVNRGGQYMLLAIIVNLCALTISIYRALVKSNHHQSNTKLNILTTVLPFLFMMIAYSLDTEEESADNYNLNIVRHAFNCSMRFSSMVEEWLVLWLPFCVSGVLTAVFSFISWQKIRGIQRTLTIGIQSGSGPIQVRSEGQKKLEARASSRVQSEGQRKLEAQRRRLVRIAAMVSGCLLLNVGIALYVTGQQSAWTEYEEKKLDCLIKTSATRNYNDYGLNENDDVKKICMVEEEHSCSRQAKNIQRWHPLEKYSKTPFTPSCVWNPSIWTDGLVCNFDELVEQYPHSSTDEDHIYIPRWCTDPSENNCTHLRRDTSCECTCSDMLQVVERPSTFVMTLSFAAQSMIAAIVALNLGFREDNLNLWKRFFRKTFRPGKATTQVRASASNFQWDSNVHVQSYQLQITGL